MIPIVRSLFIFLLAGLCEIGGGYLIWLWLREDRPVWYGILGALSWRYTAWLPLCRLPILLAFMPLMVVFL